MSAQTQNQHSPGASEEIFLTPRVVDRRAFETFASMLRVSVEKAERESDLLARRAEAAASVLERLEGFVGSHADVFKRAADLIDTIDQRQRTAGDTLDSLTKRVELAQQAARDVEALVRERGEAFEARLTTLAAGTLDSFEAARQSLSGDASIMRRDLSQRLDELRQRGESLLASLEERAEHAGQNLAEQLTHLETARETLRVEHRETTRKLDEQAGELREGLRTEGSAVKRELDVAARSLREAIAASSAHRDTIERAAELAVSRVQAGANEQTLEVERLSRRAEAVVRDHRESIDTLSAEIEARLESARDRAEAELGRAGERARASAAEIEQALAERLREVESASRVLEQLELATREASERLEAIESGSESIDRRIAALVDASYADRIACTERENGALRDELGWALAKQTELQEKVDEQANRIAVFEKRLDELAARQAEPEREAEAESEPEPLVPVVVKPRTAKKAPARKAAPKKTAAKKAPTKKATSKPAASKTKSRASSTGTTRKKAAPKKVADEVEVAEAVS